MESPPLKAQSALVLLDRDGVLIEDTGHLGRPEGVELIDGVATGLDRLANAGFDLAVVSNQAGIAKGLYTESDMRAVNARIQELISAGGGPEIAAWYHCPHHPSGSVARLAIACRCRKPAPGMLEDALSNLGAEADSSYMIGNMHHDVVAANRAGVKAILLMTTPAKAEEDPALAESEPWRVTADFDEAVAAILSDCQERDEQR